MADTWDFLTRTPTAVTPKNYQLRGPLSTVTRNGETYAQWQHKPSEGWGARIWFYVDEPAKKVCLVEVWTSHPEETL